MNAFLINRRCITGAVWFGITLSTVAHSAPSWIASVPDLYPSAVYLTGVASAANVEQARQRAITNLSQGLKVEVNSRLSTSEEQNITQNANGINTRSKSFARDDTQLSSQVELLGVEIAKMEFDETDRQYYALAVVDKRILLKQWQGEAHAQEKAAWSALKNAEDNLSATPRKPIEALQWVQKAEGNIADRQAVIENMALLQVSTEMDEETKKTTELSAKAQSIKTDSLKKLSLWVVASEESRAGKGAKNALSRSLLKALAKSGIVARAGTSKAIAKDTYRLEYQLVIDKPIFQDEMWWVLGKVRLALYGFDNVRSEEGDKDGEEIAPLSQNDFTVRSASAYEQNINSQFAKKLDTKINTELPKLLCPSCAIEE